MQKHLKDQSSPTTTYEIPDNVRAQVMEIISTSTRTYPDHAESRNNMIKQGLINAWSKERLLLESQSAISRDLVTVVAGLHNKLQKYEEPAKEGWFKRMWRRLDR